MLKMGERIKRRRESLNIQVNDLAKTIGVTSSLISQIEKAKAFPSIFSLKKIADALKISVGSLIGEDETFSKNPFVKFKDKRLVQANDAGTTLFLLSNHEQYKLMEPHLLVFPPMADSNGLINIKEGQSFFYIQNGTFRIDLNAEHFELKTGDSFYLNSGLQCILTNISKLEAKLLWILSNPAHN